MQFMTTSAKMSGQRCVGTELFLKAKIEKLN